MALLETIGTVAGGAVALGAAAWASWSKYKQNQSDATVNSVMDRAQIDIIGTLTKQRDDAIIMSDKNEAKAEKAQTELDAADDQIRDLNTQIGNLTSQVSLLRQLIERLSVALDMTKNQLNQIIANSKAGTNATLAPAGLPEAT